MTLADGGAYEGSNPNSKLYFVNADLPDWMLVILSV